MSALEWAAQLAVILLLGATLPMAWRLDRLLRALRGDRAALEQGAAGLGDAARQAESLLVRLRGAAELGVRQVNERVAAAERLRDDLGYLLERAEALADRLEAAVQAARPLAGGAAPRSDAERELIRALGLPR
jgi:ABC-type transporter Mla subunit MlaD